MSDASRMACFENMVLRSYHMDDVIIQKGTVGDSLYFVDEGTGSNPQKSAADLFDMAHFVVSSFSKNVGSESDGQGQATQSVSGGRIFWRDCLCGVGEKGVWRWARPAAGAAGRHTQKSARNSVDRILKVYS